MEKTKSSMSKAKNYKEIGDFWDNHDLSNYWDYGKKAQFEVDIDSETTYYAIDKKLSKKVQDIARQEGISPHTLVNLWVQEKLLKQKVN